MSDIIKQAQMEQDVKTRTAVFQMFKSGDDISVSLIQRKCKVGYNSAAEGPFDKFITITYNTTQTKQIRIKGTVWKAPEGPAPSNSSVELLKKQTF